MFRDKSIVYPFPETPPKFIGFLSQNYRPRNGSPAKSFQKWIDTIKEEVAKSLIPALTPLEMAIDENTFTSTVAAIDKPFNLANISDFNSLIAQSQKHNVPVFVLDDSQIEQSGKVLESMRSSRDRFRGIFSQLATDVHKLTETV